LVNGAGNQEVSLISV